MLLAIPGLWALSGCTGIMRRPPSSIEPDRTAVRSVQLRDSSVVTFKSAATLHGDSLVGETEKGRVAVPVSQVVYADVIAIDTFQTVFWSGVVVVVVVGIYLAFRNSYRPTFNLGPRY